MTTTSLVSFALTQILWPAILTIVIVFAIYWLARKKYSLKVAVVASILTLGVALLFWWPKFVPGNDKLFGPADGPAISFTNIIDFFKKAPDMESVADIAHDPNDVPPPSITTTPQHVKFELVAKEVISKMADGVEFNYWTYNGTVPGPFLRVREGDTVELTLKNDSSSVHPHNIDLHAVTGPGGGATVTNVNPGEEKTFTFKALNPGLYVYHCAHPNVATHMAHGMYGLILVDPIEKLPDVDQEFYVMQGEFYSKGALGKTGLQTFDAQKMLDGKPEYIVFNGRTGGIVEKMKAKTGERIRIYVGNGGVNLISSFHVIGEIFDAVYPEGAMGLGTDVHKNIQTTLVPAGGATAVEFTVDVPGKYILVDHALARLDRGAWGTLEVTGNPNPEIFNGSTDGHSHGH